MKKRSIEYIKFSNKFYNTIIKPFDKLLFPVIDKDELIKERIAKEISLNKIPNVADIYNPEWGDVLKSIKMIWGMDENSFHRKIWEFTHILFVLKKLGYLHPESEGLSIAAGREQILYYLAHKIKKIVGVDLYEGNYIGGEDEPDIPLNPEKYAPFIYPENNLELKKMDALNLEFENNSFDFVFSASSIEHFGSEKNIKKSINEMRRVLKPGGLCVITTELKLNRLARDIPNTKLFKLDNLLNIFKDCNFKLIDENIDIKIERQYLDNWVKLPQEVFKSPHVILRFFSSVFTSLALVYKKDGDDVKKGDWKESVDIIPLNYKSSMSVKLEKDNIKKNEKINLNIKLENKSNFDWYVKGVSHRIAIGIKLLDLDENVIDPGFGEILIPEDIKKGQTYSFKTSINSEKLSLGKYKLFIGLKRELMTWFFEKGEKASIKDITIV